MSEYEKILSLMKEKYTSIAGCSPKDASDIGIRFKVLANELTKISQKADIIKKQMFPHTSEGEYLDLHATTRGIERKKGTCSTGYVTFIRRNSAFNDIYIPKGITVSCLGHQEFVTITEGIIKKGKTDCTVRAVCKEIGIVGNIASNSISNIVTAISGVDSVTNKEMFLGGTDKENDEELRKRLMNTYKQVSNGTNGAFYYRKAIKYEGITSVKVIPKADGVGTVHIIVDSKNTDVPKEKLEQIRNDFNEFKEINVEVTVRQANVRKENITVNIANEEGFSKIQAEKATKEKIQEYVSSLNIGQPLYISKLIFEILNLEEIRNVKILIPCDDVRPLQDEIIRVGDITVNMMAVI